MDDLYFRLAFDEAVENTRVHGNKCDPQKQITVTIQAKNDIVVIIVCDEGKGFCLHDIPDPLSHKNRFKDRGRGICLMTGVARVDIINGGQDLRIEV